MNIPPEVNAYIELTISSNKTFSCLLAAFLFSGGER